MAKKSITEQIEEAKNEIDRLENEKRQLNNQMHKIQARESEKERKARTRKLIEKGAILESIEPNLAQLEGEYLKECLQIIFTNHETQQVAKNNLILQQRGITG